jgi:hypothetical protein
VTRDGKTELLSPGEYECALKRTNGTWRFVDRRVTMDRPFAMPDMQSPMASSAKE